MGNDFKKAPLSEEVQQEMQDSVEEKVDASEDFIKKILSGGSFSSGRVIRNMPFLLFLFFLGIVYIANRHYAENTARKIDHLSREVKVMGWEYKTLKADLMLKSTQSEIASKVDTFGLKILTAPPKKLLMVDNQEKK